MAPYFHKLPFISEEHLIEVIEELERFDETKNFISYFIRNYLNRYNFKDWSVSTKSSKETITNNVVERHNNTLRKAIREQPSLDEFQNNLSILENRYYRRYWNQKKSPLVKERQIH